SAVNEALHLAREVKTLYFIHRSKETLRINETYQKLAALPNVIFYLPYEITKINGQDQLASLEILNKETGKVETLVCNALFEFIGATPNNEMLNQLEVKKDPAGYLMVDENLMSSVKNLYVIGDLKSYPVRQIALAVGDGIKVATVINEALARER
ncbi:MAG: NAD(P)/FAD-dependent oxidoreductase, partial [Erysipelotrichaceae bacterium]|nr:NAD(P)/FAD-dependent oxidoreductase [Erysipelotrichaceae bacterium]